MEPPSKYETSLKIDSQRPYIDAFGEYLADSNDDFDWMWAGQQIRQILEAYNGDPQPPQITFYPGRIADLRMRTFYAVLVCYLFDQHNWSLPKTFKVTRPLGELWSPRKRTRKSDTSPSEYFLRYNISIPSGELQWI